MCFHPSVLSKVLAVTSHNDVIESADPAQPLAERLADARVGYVTGELAQAGVQRRLQRQEGGVGQGQNLVQERQDHRGPSLQGKETRKLKVPLCFKSIPSGFS